MDVVEELLRAREAFDRRDWVAAYEGLSAAGTMHSWPPTSPIWPPPRSWSAVTTTASRRSSGRTRLTSHAGDQPAAVRSAFWLAMTLMDRGEYAVANGWISRADRLLEGFDQDTVEHGYVLFFRMLGHILGGDPVTGLDEAATLTSYGTRFGDGDLLAAGLMAQGRCLLYLGRVPEGVRMLDEAMVGVTTGEVSPIFAGHTYCSLIEACQEISDFDRVAQWTTALTTWCGAQVGLVPFTGQCAVHRGQVMRVRGAYEQAIAEFDGAAARYVAAGTPAAAGLAFAEKGELLRIRGEYDAAEEAFEQAVGLGHDPQPAHALLSLGPRPDRRGVCCRTPGPRRTARSHPSLPAAARCDRGSPRRKRPRRRTPPRRRAARPSQTRSTRARSRRWPATPSGPSPWPRTDPRTP